jgi:hypothetical protein
MLSPFAPHTMEELWQMYGHADGLSAAHWPPFDADVAKAEELEIPVQVNGKLRGVVKVPPSITDAELEKIALADANVQAHIAGKTVKKVVIVKSRLVSICHYGFLDRRGVYQPRGGLRAIPIAVRTGRGVLRVSLASAARSCRPTSRRSASMFGNAAVSTVGRSSRRIPRFRAVGATRWCRPMRASTAWCAARSSRSACSRSA